MGTFSYRGNVPRFPFHIFRRLLLFYKTVDSISLHDHINESMPDNSEKKEAINSRIVASFTLLCTKRVHSLAVIS